MNCCTLWKWMGALGIALAAIEIPDARAEPQAINFNRDIRPLLSDRCYRCHGPDEGERQANLRLDQQAGATASLDSGERAIVPGSSATSALVARITASDPELKMPPPASGKSLTAEEIDLLRRWIDEGAPWQAHWSFLRAEQPEPPAVPDESLVRNPIDRFIQARLARASLSPSPPAEKVTLLRRVTLDLTGLPPKPEELDAFLADESDNAYEKVVDRLLQSPAYGEHMARYWLDAARFGDTHGLHLDNERSLWLYRDWVIQAFNDNLPFDQFTIEQLAGDLLPEAGISQKIASGFNRCNVTTSEGGSIDEEVRVRYAVDRTETVATIWMGLTLGCAVCHDHKFDPVTQKEFYQLYAFFNSAADAAMDGNALTPPPVMKVPTSSQTAALEALDAELAALRQQITGELAKVEYQEPATAASVQEPQDYVWIEDGLPKDAQPQGDTPWEFVGKPEHPVFAGEKSSTRTAAALSQHFFTGANPGLKIGEGDKLFAYVYLDPANPPKEIMLQWNDGVWEHRAIWGEDLIPWGATGQPSRLPIGPLPPAGEWVRLEVEAAKVGLNPGAVLNGWAFTQHGGRVYWDHAGIVTRTPQEGQGFTSLLAWEAYEKAQSKSSVPNEVREALKVEPAARSEDQTRRIREYFLEHVCTTTRATFDPLHRRLDELQKQRGEQEGRIPTTMVMADMPQPRQTFVLIRGAYDKKGEEVTPGVPAILPPLPEDAPRTRLGLARWLTDPGHPLTARVTVNRFWQQVFGQGLVKTPEDFGSQGEWPTHPELLDWLAGEFVTSGWNVKGLMKQLVMSHTYRQSSRVSPELLQRDPANELLARGPRFRLDAEAIRDSALAVSGLLVERPGGKSVKPYQPEGLWEAVAFVGSTTSKFSRDSGDALYRRSLYTFWKRTSPPPALTTFDAPSRETCTVRRPRTNTPLQALALMNDVQYVEAARRLAERMALEGGESLEQRLAFAFRLTTARTPQADELAVLSRVYHEQLARFQARPESAEKLLAVGETPRREVLTLPEHAALAMVANLVLNLDEAITKE